MCTLKLLKAFGRMTSSVIDACLTSHFEVRTRLSVVVRNSGLLAALFLEVTDPGFARRELECTVGEEIQLSLISPWEKFVAYH